MDKNITVRFFDVLKKNNETPDFRGALRRIHKLGGPATREGEVGPDHTIRLERLDSDRNYVAGEFTRVQTTNYPSEVHPDRVAPLRVAVPLGHGIAFRFRRSDSLLAIQYEPRTLAPSRILSYIAVRCPDADFLLQSRMRTDAWERLDRYPLRKLTIRVGSPASLIEDPQRSVSGAFRQLGFQYEAPSITLELSMDRKKGQLGPAVKDMAKAIFQMGQDDQVELKRLDGLISTEEGSDKFDLLDEVLSTTERVNLPDNDPERSFEVRQDWLAKKMRDHA